MNETKNLQGEVVDTGEHHETTIQHVKEVNAAIARVDSHLDNRHVALGWRSWLVVLVTMFACVSSSNLSVRAFS
jgi:hypothetical protein